MDAPKRCIDFIKKITKKNFCGPELYELEIAVRLKVEALDGKNGASHHEKLTPVSHYEIISHYVKWCTATMVQCNIMVQCNNDAPQHNDAPHHNHNGSMVICCTATWAIRICCTATIWRAV